MPETTDIGPLGVKSGNGQIDPSRNVLDLVEAATKRHDDLRTADKELILALFTAEKEHSREIMTMDRRHSAELREAEAKRIDAIRAVDVGAVGVAAERQAAAAGVLASSQTTSAEQLRALVQSQAVSVASAQQQLIEPIMTRLAAMERTQYEGVGKERVTDPAMAELSIAVKSLVAAQSAGSGATQKGADSSRIFFLVIMAIIGLSTVLIAVISLATRN